MHLFSKYDETFTVRDWSELHVEIGIPLIKIFKCR